MLPTYSWGEFPAGRGWRGPEAGAGHGASLSLLPTIAELWAALHPGRAWALHSLCPKQRGCGQLARRPPDLPLHGGKLGGEKGLGRWGARAPTSSPGPPVARPSLPCQGLSKLQELVKYHIYGHGQVRGPPPRGWPACTCCRLLRVLSVLSGLPGLGGPPLALPVWTSVVQRTARGQGSIYESLGQDGVWPRGVWLVSSLRPPSPLPQLTVEKLISKGRVLTMANQVLAVNISEEVRNIWNEWTNGVAGDDWPVIQPLSDLPSLSKPCGGQALVGVVWEAGTGQILLLAPDRLRGLQGGEWGRGAPWGTSHVGQGTEAGAVLPEQGALPRRGGRDSGAGWAFISLSCRRGGGSRGEADSAGLGGIAHWALPQGRILLGPEGVLLRRVDVLAANGVIHMLEGILLPPTILPILPKHCSQEQHQVVVVSACRTPRAFLSPQCCLCKDIFQRRSPRVSGWDHGGHRPPWTRPHPVSSPAHFETLLHLLQSPCQRLGLLCCHSCAATLAVSH